MPSREEFPPHPSCAGAGYFKTTKRGGEEISGIKYVAFNKEECLTPERAAALLKAQEESERRMSEEYGGQPSPVMKRYIPEGSSEIITVSAASVDIFQLEDYFDAQRDVSKNADSLLGIKRLRTEYHDGVSVADYGGGLIDPEL